MPARENYSGRNQNEEKGDVQISVYQTLIANNSWNVLTEFCCLYYYYIYIIIYWRGLEGIGGGGYFPHKALLIC